MDDTHLYHIQIAGQVAESDLATFCPPSATLTPEGETCSILTLRTDQSGLVGLIRQLHGLGLVLLAVQTK
jgi:hypothetical protein